MRDLPGLAAVVVAVLAVSRQARRAAWRVLRGVCNGALALVAVVVERRRGPVRALPAVRRWGVRLSVVDPAAVVLEVADATVVGVWETSEQVRAEALRRAEEAGIRPPAGGRLYVEAWPVAPSTRPVRVR